MNLQQYKDKNEQTAKTILMIAAFFPALIVIIYSLFSFGILPLFFWLSTLLSANLAMAHIRANSIQVSSDQYPELYSVLEEYSQKLSLKSMPELYVIREGEFNTYILKLAKSFSTQNVILLSSEVVDACYDSNNPEGIRYSIAYSLAYVAYDYFGLLNRALLLGASVPFLYQWYSRCCVLSCDALALALTENYNTSKNMMFLLAGSNQLAQSTNDDALIRQWKQCDTLLTTQVAALISFEPHILLRFERIYEKKSTYSSTSLEKK